MLNNGVQSSGFRIRQAKISPHSGVHITNMGRYCCLVTPQIHAAYKLLTCAELSITSESSYTPANKRTIDFSANGIWMTLRKAAIDWDTVARYFIANTFVRPRCVTTCSIFAAKVNVRGAFINIGAIETISNVSWQTITVIRTILVDA